MGREGTPEKGKYESAKRRQPRFRVVLRGGCWQSGGFAQCIPMSHALHSHWQVGAGFTSLGLLFRDRILGSPLGIPVPLVRYKGLVDESSEAITRRSSGCQPCPARRTCPEAQL